jgi:RNA recognition motif-containing protein
MKQTNKTANSIKTNSPKSASKGPLRTGVKSKKLKPITETKFTFLEKDYTGSTIYIGNLNYKKDEIGVRDLFKKYGKVRRVKLMRDEKTQLKKGFGFVQMPNIEDAGKAIKSLNGKIVDGRTLKVSSANSNV